MKASKPIVLVVVGVVALPILFFGYFELRKHYWDWKVNELCAKDGGDTIVQSVQLIESEFALYVNRFGQVEIPSAEIAPANVLIVHKWTHTYIRRSDPEVRRDELLIFRRSDGKKLAQRTSYSRVGGDLIALHPSYFSCPKNSSDIFAEVIAKLPTQSSGRLRSNPPLNTDAGDKATRAG